MKKILTFFLLPIFAFVAKADDSQFPIPDALEKLNGGRVENAEDWENNARPQILKFFDDNVYGAIPPRPDSVKYELAESSDNALDGIAIRRQYKVTVAGKGGSHTYDALVYIPKNAGKKVPAFVCPNFFGNHAISPEKEIFLPKCFIRGIKTPEALEASRASKLSRIPVKNIIAQGFAIATFCYNDIYPDYINKSGESESIYRIFGDGEVSQKLAINAWAWGNIRTLDLLETMPEIDTSKIAIAGHSRLAKTAAVTGAHEKRFAYVCINNGGSKRLCFLPNLQFPFWFSKNLKKYVENKTTGISVEELKKLCADKNKPPLPSDQYCLFACIAPRMLYVSSSSGDKVAPPEMMLETLINTTRVFALYGAKDFPKSPKIEGKTMTFHGDVAFHCKEGPHSITEYDWGEFIEYAKKRGW